MYIYIYVMSSVYQPLTDNVFWCFWWCDGCGRCDASSRLREYTFASGRLKPRVAWWSKASFRMISWSIGTTKFPDVLRELNCEKYLQRKHQLFLLLWQISFLDELWILHVTDLLHLTGDIQVLTKLRMADHKQLGRSGAICCKIWETRIFLIKSH